MFELKERMKGEKEDEIEGSKERARERQRCTKREIQHIQAQHPTSLDSVIITQMGLDTYLRGGVNDRSIHVTVTRRAHERFSDILGDGVGPEEAQFRRVSEDL